MHEFRNHLVSAFVGALIGIIPLWLVTTGWLKLIVWACIATIFYLIPIYIYETEFDYKKSLSLGFLVGLCLGIYVCYLTSPT